MIECDGKFVVDQATGKLVIDQETGKFVVCGPRCNVSILEGTCIFVGPSELFEDFSDFVPGDYIGGDGDGVFIVDEQLVLGGPGVVGGNGLSLGMSPPLQSFNGVFAEVDLVSYEPFARPAIRIVNSPTHPGTGSGISMNFQGFNFPEPQCTLVYGPIQSAGGFVSVDLPPGCLQQARYRLAMHFCQLTIVVHLQINGETVYQQAHEYNPATIASWCATFAQLVNPAGPNPCTFDNWQAGFFNN